MAKRREPSYIWRHCGCGNRRPGRGSGRGSGRRVSVPAPAPDGGGRRGNDGRSRGLDGSHGTGSCWFGCRRRENKRCGPSCAKGRTPRSSAGCEDARPSEANDEKSRYASERRLPGSPRKPPSLVDVRHKRPLGSTHLRVGKSVGPSARTRPSLVCWPGVGREADVFRPPMSSVARPIRRPAASANRRAETNAGDVRPSVSREHDGGCSHDDAQEQHPPCQTLRRPSRCRVHRLDVSETSLPARDWVIPWRQPQTSSRSRGWRTLAFWASSNSYRRCSMDGRHGVLYAHASALSRQP